MVSHLKDATFVAIQKEIRQRRRGISPNPLKFVHLERQPCKADRLNTDSVDVKQKEGVVGALQQITQ